MSDRAAIPDEAEIPRSWSSRIVRLFLESQISALLLILSTGLGLYALFATPREEDPQIVVPVVDVMVEMPGATASEIERIVARPFEGILAALPGVEHVYSTSSPGKLIASAQFFVGEDRERSITKVATGIEENRHLVPAGVTGWQIRPLDFDRVPIVTVVLFSRTLGEDDLRAVGQEVLSELRSVEDVGETTIIGGRSREVQVVLDPVRLAAYGLSPLEVAGFIREGNARTEVGNLVVADRESPVRVGPFLESADDVAAIVLPARGAASEARSIHLRDVAEVRERPAEASNYTRFGFGAAASLVDGEIPPGYSADEELPCVTIGIAKRRGTNAVTVADALEERLDEIRRSVLPAGVELRVVRNFGDSANEKVHELVAHLGFAVVSVLALVGFVLGWREALVVALAVPVTLALTIATGGLFGYSINRVSLFALILSLGLLVDDPIVDVENIHRHYARGKHSPLVATLIAIDEIRPPTVLATFAVMLSFLPLFSMRGMLGPYMEPMAFNVPMAMALSLFIAFTVTPWAAYRFLDSSHGKAPAGDEVSPQTRRFFERWLRPFLVDRRKARWFLLAVGAAFVAAVSLIPLGQIPIKLLPYDNKDELLLVVDAQAGTPLESTDALLRSIGSYLRTVPEVRSYQTYAGTSSPIDLNGLVRRYFLRQGGNVGEVRVNVVHKHDRAEKMHGIALRMRRPLDAIGRAAGATIKIVEIPSGPPVLAGIVGEIRGPGSASAESLADAGRLLEATMAGEAGLTEVDSSVEADHDRVDVRVDRPKAALHGISVEAVVATLRLAIGGEPVGAIRTAAGREPILIRAQLPPELRADGAALRTLIVPGDGGHVALGEIARLAANPAETPIFRKNRERVAFVMAEATQHPPIEAVMRIGGDLAAMLPEGYEVDWTGEGEWKTSFDALKDLGFAFALSLTAIYLLLVVQTGSLALPGVVMLAIPLTMIGVFPGFWVLNLLFSRTVDGLADPMVFTGPSLIGLIALSGIVVRNSIILIDFIATLRERGLPLEDATLEAVSTRLRPILLTAGAALLGAWIIIMDPIFSGLAWAIIFGLTASTTLTLAVVPIVYVLLFRETEA